MCARLAESPADYVSHSWPPATSWSPRPGYGIVADCLANRVAVLFTERGPFREYDVLAQALPRLGQARFVPRADLLAGALGPHLDALLQSPAELAAAGLQRRRRGRRAPARAPDVAPTTRDQNG